MEVQREYHVPPAPRDGLIVTLGVVTEHHLSNDTISEHEKDESSKEFGQGFSQKVSDTTPHEVWLLLDGICLRDFVIDQRAVFSKSRHAHNRRSSAGGLRHVVMRVFFVSGLGHGS